MPYVAIKSWPKDEETKKRVVEKVNQAMIDALGCAPEALTISYEMIPKEEWEEKVKKVDIEPKMDKVMILSGVKKY
ncbi:MAG: hypothetical protein E7423_07390 [Ruminococcaceae bacterium]|jgi:4-oxalocrotonate tautomerase|nr:hypothetical protein [Oscillospiraceae bacterium]